MVFKKAAAAADLRPGEKIKITLDQKVYLLANIGGTFYAVDNTCPHMGGSLGDGFLDGANIVCPRHGSVFDVTTGKAVKPGKLLFVPVKIHDLKSYPVKIDGGDVLLGVEE